MGQTPGKLLIEDMGLKTTMKRRTWLMMTHLLHHGSLNSSGPVPDGTGQRSTVDNDGRRPPRPTSIKGQREGRGPCAPGVRKKFFSLSLHTSMPVSVS